MISAFGVDDGVVSKLRGRGTFAPFKFAASRAGKTTRVITLPSGKKVKLKPVGNPKKRRGVVATRKKKAVSYLDLDRKSGEISMIETRKKYRRQGLGTAMLEEAERLGMKPKTSTLRTDDGEAFAQTVGRRKGIDVGERDSFMIEPPNPANLPPMLRRGTQP